MAPIDSPVPSSAVSNPRASNDSYPSISIRCLEQPHRVRPMGSWGSDRWNLALAFAVAVLAGLGCSKENNIVSNNGTGGQAGSSQAQLPDCSGETAPTGLKGSPIVSAGNLAGDCFWIDKLEASVAEYTTFLASSPAKQTDVSCQWNDSYEPICDGGSAPTGNAELPVRCVDWCDAQAFCAWAGKELCHGDYLAPADAARSDWYSACSNGSVSAYPYDAEYDGSACNGVENPSSGCPDACGPLPVTGQGSCKTASGTLNLSGNVSEWVDECKDSSGAADLCNVRGGSFLGGAEKIQCAKKEAPARQTRAEDIGFRCCSYTH